MAVENSQVSQVQRSAEAALAEKDAHIKLISDRAARCAGEADQWRTLAEARGAKIKEMEVEIATLKADKSGASE